MIIKSAQPLRVLSSAVCGGGWTRARNIVNMWVPKNYQGADPARDLGAFIAEAGLKGDTVGLMTAVRSEFAVQRWAEVRQVTVGVIATAGVSNATAAGLALGNRAAAPGTINLVLLVDTQLMPAAMVNAVITATEAKARALRELDVRCATSGELATGTSTDAVVVATTDRGRPWPYAGPATEIGHTLAQLVHAAVRQAVLEYNARVRDRGEG